MPIKLSDHLTPRKLFRFTIPTILMMVFLSVYYIVDGFFVSNYVGKTAFAGLNIIFPALMLFSVVGFVFSGGGSALVSKTMGEGKAELAREYFSLIVCTAVVISIGLAVIGYVITAPLSKLMGADTELLYYSVLYGHILFPAIPFFVMQNMFQGFMITEGKPGLGFKFILIPGLTNMALDALFVAGLRWGLPGAAYATFISQVMGALLPLSYFTFHRSGDLYLVKFRFCLSALTKTVSNGFSNFMTGISSSVVGMLYNYQLLYYAGENGMAAFSIITYIAFTFQAIFVGYSEALMPVVGYNYGARRKDELHYLLHTSLKVMGGLGLSLTVLAMILAPWLASIFAGYDRSLELLTIHAFRIFSLSFLFAGFSSWGDAFFTGLNNGFISASISFTRTAIFETTSVLLLPLVFGAEGLWFAVTVAEMAATALTFFLFAYFRKSYGY